MKNYAKITNGKVVSTVSLADHIDPTAIDQSATWVEITEEYQSVDELYFDGFKVQKVQPKPSPYHVFDSSSGSWVLESSALAEITRLQRYELLAKSDWTQLPDVPLATKEAWAAYRQALRDITEQPGFPFDVVWPQPPG